MIRPRPADDECELAKRLHNTLVRKGLMKSWSQAELVVKSAPLFPVTSGYLTREVPIFIEMLVTRPEICVRCSTVFQAVDITSISNVIAWIIVYGSYGGDWCWMVLGRPTKGL